MASARAFLSLVMLTGFYVVAFVEFAAVTAIAFGLAKLLPGPLGLLLSLPLYAVAVGAVAAAWWTAVRSRHEPMPGVIVTDVQAAPLWTMVRDLATRAQTRTPDEIRVVAEVNASVSEASRFLGILPGKRYLYLGMPLLQVLTPQQLRAIIAHELGHYSHAHTRLAPVAYRGRAAISGTIGRIHRMNPLGWSFRGYYRLYLLVDRAVSRVQEMQADGQAVASAGKDATITSLIEIHALAAAFTHFMKTQVSPRAEYGYLPADLYQAFAEFLQERAAELSHLRQSVLDSESSVWDTHPAVRERVTEIAKRSSPPVVEEPPQELVGGLSELGRVIAPHVLPRENCQLLPWNDFVSAASNARLEAEVDTALRRVRRHVGTRQLTISQILVRAREDEALRAKLPVVLALLILRSGATRWQPSWNGPALLVDADGEPFPLADLARAALKPDGDVLLARRLKRLGIAFDPEGLSDLKGPELNPRLLGGLGNVNVGAGSILSTPQADLLVLSTGLVLIETARDTNEGNKRLREVLNRLSLHEIMDSYRFVPFAEVSHATLVHASPVSAEVTLYSGEVITLREAVTGDRLTDESARVLVDVLKEYP